MYLKYKKMRVSGFPTLPSYFWVILVSACFYFSLDAEALSKHVNNMRTSRLIQAACCTLIKAIFHFNRIVAKRTIFHCFVSTQAELIIWTQNNTLLFATVRLKWKTAFTHA